MNNVGDSKKINIKDLTTFDILDYINTDEEFLEYVKVSCECSTGYDSDLDVVKRYLEKKQGSLKKPSVLILGHGRHGKDTVGELLQKHTGFTFASSSREALDAIYPALSKITGIIDKEVLFSRRNESDQTRALWKALIGLYNTPDPSALTRKILSKHQVYVGLRSDREFQASKHLFDVVFWVDASKRKPLEPSMGVQYDPGCMILVDNNGSEEDLEGILLKALDKSPLRGYVKGS